MIISRGVGAIRALKCLRNNQVNFKQAIRNSGHDFYYREIPPPAGKDMVRLAEIVQGTMWWWILWHLWTEPDHIFGEFEYPDPRKWTDAELGIPDTIEVE